MTIFSIILTQAILTPSILIDPHVGSTKRKKQAISALFSPPARPIIATFSQGRILNDTCLNTCSPSGFKTTVRSRVCTPAVVGHYMNFRFVIFFFKKKSNIWSKENFEVQHIGKEGRKDILTAAGGRDPSTIPGGSGIISTYSLIRSIASKCISTVVDCRINQYIYSSKLVANVRAIPAKPALVDLYINNIPMKNERKAPTSSTRTNNHRLVVHKV